MSQSFKLGEPCRRSGWIAGLLGLITPGLGLLYCGRAKSAFAVLVAAIIPWIIVALVTDPTAKIALILLDLLIWVVQLLWGMVIAFRLGGDYRLNRFNRVIVYALFFMLFAAYNQIDSAYFTSLTALATDSMAPGIARYDMVILNKFIYRLRSPEVGDVVIYRCDSLAIVPYIGRVLAVPGDRIELRDGVYLANQDPIDRAPSPRPELQRATIPRMANLPEIQLGADQYFVAGDNQVEAYDSRFTGPVSGDLIAGKVDAVMLSVRERAPLLGVVP